MSARVASAGASRVAAITASLGLAAILALAARALAESNPPPGVLQHVAVTLIIGGPFAVSLLALRFSDRPLRGAVWIGAGVVGIATPFLIFSMILILFSPVYLALVVAGGWALAAGTEPRRAVALLLAPLLAGVVAIAGLHAFRDPSCWYRAGDTWERRPYGRTISLPRRLSSGEQASVGACGDYTSGGAVATASGAWLLASGVIVALGRPRPSTQDAG